MSQYRTIVIRVQCISCLFFSVLTRCRRVGTGKWHNSATRTITGIENIEAKATENKSWQHVSLVDFTGRRTAFYFCFAPIIDELWALPPFLSLTRAGGRVDVIRHCLRCFCSSAHIAIRSHKARFLTSLPRLNH